VPQRRTEMTKLEELLKPFPPKGYFIVTATQHSNGAKEYEIHPVPGKPTSVKVFSSFSEAEIYVSRQKLKVLRQSSQIEENKLLDRIPNAFGNE